jgi:hypothetical protein
MTERPETSAVPEQTADQKLPYHAPVLREHGTVDQLTKANVESFQGSDSVAYDDPTPSLS